MKINPFKNPRLKAGFKKNAFPLSHTESFTAPFGALLPVAFYHLTAGSKIRINMENQTIMTPVIRPPFVRMFEHFEFFAVPMCQIHQAFDNLITSQSNYDNSAVAYFNKDSAGNSEIPHMVPMFSGAAIERLLYVYHTKSDVFGCNKAANMCRLFDLLGYGNFYDVVTSGLDAPSEVPDSSTDPQRYLRNLLPMNYYNLLAYQKIYYSHYCNSKYESINNNAFNIDDFQAGIFSGQETETSDMKRFASICELHYRWKSRDYFTSVIPNVLPSSADFGFSGLLTEPNSVTAWQLFGIPGTYQERGQEYPNLDNANGDDGSDYSSSNGYRTNVAAGDLNVASIRFAFAYDKLLRRMRQAGSDFNSQMLAQFGVVPSDARHGAAKYLGGFTNQLRFDEVTATADNDSAALGDIAGKMSSYNNNSRIIEYEAKENTIVMCIYSTSIDMQYHSFCQQRENLRRYRFDWFNEVFQDMGPQALFATEYSYIPQAMRRDYQAQRIDSMTNLKSVIGYVKRYLEYKTKVNHVHGLLQWPYNNPDAKSWVVQNSDQYQTNSSDPDLRWQILEHIPFALPNLVLSPFTLNDIVTTPYSGSWSTDHFNVFAYFNTKVIAPISADGELF